MSVLLAAMLLIGQAQADEPDADTVSAAAEAGVPVDALLGAMNSTGLAGRVYLVGVGELAAPVPPGWPIGGALGQRIYCVEGIESHHGAAMYNPIPVGREHASGYLGWLPSTAAHWGVQIGNRASEWMGAARILAQGERFARTQFYGVGAGLC